MIEAEGMWTLVNIGSYLCLFSFFAATGGFSQQDSVSDEWMDLEIKHRGKLNCVFGTGKHIWTAGDPLCIPEHHQSLSQPSQPHVN